MKYFIFTILTVLIWSCQQKTKPFPNETYVIKTYSIALDTSVTSTVFYKDHYYCLTSNGTFICLNNKFEIDSSITNSIKKQKFDFLYLSGDSLIASIYTKDDSEKNYFLNNEIKWELLTKKPTANPLFEDTKFTVHQCCIGEFGGTIFFTDKKTKHVYSCPATCARIINKIGEIYFVTNTLAHGSGSTEILKIEDPTKLYELTADSLKTSCTWWTQFVTAEDNYASMKQFEIGTQKILDTIGVSTLTTFVFNDQLYSINADRNKTFISKIQGDSLFLVDSIFNNQLWSYEPENRKYSNMQLCSFSNWKTSGFLTINGNTISIVIFEQGKRKSHNR